MPWKQPPTKDISPVARAVAGGRRRRQTDAEKTLWRHLRPELDVPGTHFRRQVPIGSYVADFCCLGHRLIVELDGPVHDTPQARVSDLRRDEYLRSQGFRVVRFRNEDVALRREMVLNAIKAALGAATPTPGPSPQGGGEPARDGRR